MMYRRPFICVSHYYPGTLSWDIQLEMASLVVRRMPSTFIKRGLLQLPGMCSLCITTDAKAGDGRHDRGDAGTSVEQPVSPLLCTICD